MNDIKTNAITISNEWEYFYRVIRDTTDVSGPGFRLNPTAAGELQSLISKTNGLLEMIIREETPDETD